MPLHDPDIYGRLKDTAVKMAEALDAHMRWLDWVSTAVDRSYKLLLVFRQNAELSRDVESRIKSLREENMGIMNQLVESIEHSITSLGLSDKQALSLKNLVRVVQAHAQTSRSNSIELTNIVNSLFAGLDETLQQELPNAPNTGAIPVKGVELF